MAQKTKVKIIEKDHGYRAMFRSLGDLGDVTVGVHKEEGQVRHGDSNMTVTQLAAMHELGLGGQKARSWCVAFFDENRKALHQQVRQQLQQVLKRNKTRKQALEFLGYSWTEKMRARVDDGRVKPPIAASTAARKGHDIPLIETNQLRNAITYRIRLPFLKSIKDVAQRIAARRK